MNYLNDAFLTQDVLHERIITLRQAMSLPDYSYDHAAQEMLHEWVISRFYAFYTKFKDYIQTAKASTVEYNDMYMYWIRVHVLVPFSKLEDMQTWINSYEAY